MDRLKSTLMVLPLLLTSCGNITEQRIENTIVWYEEDLMEYHGYYYDGKDVKHDYAVSYKDTYVVQKNFTGMYNTLILTYKGSKLVHTTLVLYSYMYI